jgi:hypothetical protein
LRQIAKNTGTAYQCFIFLTAPNNTQEVIMEKNLAQRVFEFKNEETCKVRWTFTLLASPNGPMIEDLKIEAHNGTQGCKGHPQSLAALLRGRSVHELPVKELAAAGCGRAASCGQTLARCLQEIIQNTPRA